MANKYTFDHLTDYYIEKYKVTLFANIAIGATGAPTLNKKKSKGIVSITRNSAGNYTLVLSQAFQYLMYQDVAIMLVAGAPSSTTNVECIVRADNSNTSSNPTLQIEFINAAGTAVDVTSGVTLLMKMVFKYGTI